MSAKDRDKEWMVEVGKQLAETGFSLCATEGTCNALREAGLEVTELKKLAKGEHPNVFDMMQEGKVDLIINTPSGPVSRVDEVKIRSEAILRKVAIVTTESGARATADAIAFRKKNDWNVAPLQEYVITK